MFFALCGVRLRRSGMSTILQSGYEGWAGLASGTNTTRERTKWHAESARQGQMDGAAARGLPVI